MYRLLPLLLAAAKTDVDSFAKRTKRKSILLGLLALFFLTTYVLGISALVVWAASEFGTLEALLVVGGGAAIICLALIAALMETNYRDKKRKEQQSPATVYAASAGLALLPTAIKHVGVGKLLLVALTAFAATSVAKK